MSPPENTKIEQVVEAFESLAVAIAHSLILSERVAPTHYTSPELIAVNRTDARAEMATALRDFLKPTLRVVTKTEEVESFRAELRAHS
jgi:hypothetical protein